MLDSKALAAATAEIVREHVAKATEPLLRRIDELEKRQPLVGAPGKDGASITLDDVAPMIADAVERAAKALPVPKDGQDGQDGAPADPADIERLVADKVDGAIKAAEPLIAETVDRAVKALPAAKDGLDGKDGASADPREIARLVAEGIESALKMLPPAQNGKDGKDGLSVAGALIDRDGALVVTLSNGETRSLGVVVGRDGKDGERGQPGRDALRVQDIDLTLEPDGRTLVITLSDGDVAFAAELGIPAMIYRGVFSEGDAYERGDTVTWAGSIWHCNGPTTEKPGDGADAWTLAVKRGRDAKPAVL